MIINESLVARTFGVYTLQVFGIGRDSVLVPIPAIGLITFAFIVNIAGNKIIGAISAITAILKIGGILIFSLAILWASGFTFEFTQSSLGEAASPTSFIAGIALAILAFKGFTTITNSGGEVVKPEKNIGRSIMISLGICLLVYMTVALAVGSTLSISEIAAAKDYALAEAARPAFGDYGVWFTVAVAIIATASGLLASVFAVSRMLTMLTDMNIIPHRHFGMPGDVQKHMLVFTVVFAGLLAAFFDLSRIASLGAIFYLTMDIVIHWGVYRYLKDVVGARAWILLGAIILDLIVLGAFLIMKAVSDTMIIVISFAGIAGFFAFEKYYLSNRRTEKTVEAGTEGRSR